MKNKYCHTGGIIISENINSINDEFFIIDSTNINSVQNRFFGYTIQNNKIVFEDEFERADGINGSGAYVFVDAGDDEISIFQDQTGSYGIYVYMDETENYFAISNSFLKLAEFLSKSNYPISLNRDFANYYLSAGIVPLFPDETLIEEICVLPRNYNLHINKNTEEISFEKIDYQEKTISLDCEEGVAILDRWFDKYVELFRSIRHSTNSITLDLSGGYDSRVNAAIWLSASINLKNLKIFSNEKEVFSEDYEIASKIAEHFDFELNNTVAKQTIPYSMKDSINITEYSQLGFHKLRNFPIFRFAQPHYRISGHCGEIRRRYPNKPLKDYGEAILKKSKSYGNTYFNSTKTLIDRKFKELCDKYNSNSDSKELSSILYTETRNRYHYGKEFIEGYLHNKITISPLADPDLCKLQITTPECDDDILIHTFILLRHCPDLLYFNVEGNREINDKAIRYASEINEKYPYTPKDYSFIEGPQLDDDIENEENILKNGDCEKIFKDIFYSKNFIKEYEKYFTKKSYRKIRDKIDKDPNHPLQDVYSAIDILKVIEYVNINNTLRRESIGSWLESYPAEIDEREFEIEKMLDNYHTLRVDLKNFGLEDNDLEILESADIELDETTPDWFCDDKGIGHVIKTEKSKLHLKLKMINDGKIDIKLKGQFAKAQNGKKFPIYIDCTKFEVDGENMLETNTLVSHDDPIKFEKKVNNGDIISVNIEWLPFNKSSIYHTKELDSLKEENRILKEKLDTQIFNFKNVVKKIK